MFNQNVMNKKYIGSCCGNSFIILDCKDKELSKRDKADFAIDNVDKYKVDSALFLCKSKLMDTYMEIFERDGSESESCGNGTILIAYLLGLKSGRVEMKDNAAMIANGAGKHSISMSLKFAKIKEIKGEKKCLFIKFGEPHIVFLIDNLDKFDLAGVGKKIQRDYPEGVNVDAVQKVNDTLYLIRTYERGVFAETKSCGTGSLSSYLAISHFCGKMCEGPIEFKSIGGTHWVSKSGNMLKLETLRKFCKVKIIK